MCDRQTEQPACGPELGSALTRTKQGSIYTLTIGMC